MMPKFMPGICTLNAALARNYPYISDREIPPFMGSVNL